MPRKSPYPILLTAEEEQVLRARATKYTLPYFHVVHAQMILLAAEGFNNDEIAQRLDTRREIVSRWRKRFFRKRLAGLEGAVALGSPPSFSPQSWSLKSKPWLANYRPLSKCRSLA